MSVSTSRRVLDKLDGLIDHSRAISLFGITIVQTQLYYHNFPKDKTLQKVSVRVMENSIENVWCYSLFQVAILM